MPERWIHQCASRALLHACGRIVTLLDRPVQSESTPQVMRAGASSPCWVNQCRARAHRTCACGRIAAPLGKPVQSGSTPHVSVRAHRRSAGYTSAEREHTARDASGASSIRWSTPDGERAPHAAHHQSVGITSAEGERRSGASSLRWIYQCRERAPQHRVCSPLDQPMRGACQQCNMKCRACVKTLMCRITRSAWSKQVTK